MTGAEEDCCRNEAIIVQPRFGHSGHRCSGNTLKNSARKSKGGNHLNSHSRSFRIE